VWSTILQKKNLKPVPTNTSFESEDHSFEPVDDEHESIKLKVRSGNKEERFKLKRTDPMQKLFQAFCKKLELGNNRIVKFKFDGLEISGDKTPEDLEMEDDDLIDAIVK